MTTEQAVFNGWAIVDVLGHQRYIGYVTTEAFGAAVLFRIDVPALEARERTTVRPGYVGDVYAPAGTVVQEGAVAGYTKLVGAGSIYTITPCDQAAAIAALETSRPRPLMVARLPDASALPPASTGVPGPDDDGDGDGDEVCESCGQSGEDVGLRAGADVPLCDDCCDALANETRPKTETT